MNGIEIRASFPGGEEASEAQRKLQMLRIGDLNGSEDGKAFTATVGADMADRAIHLIRQTGGIAEMKS
ncbi:hypothetical protein AB6A23_09815 [Paenibacillus tarimensis]